MSRHGKCTNYSGCLLAYRGEENEIIDEQPFVCPECGKALIPVQPPATMWIRYGAAVLVLAVLGGLGFLFLKKGKSRPEKPPATVVAAPSNVSANTPPTLTAPAPEAAEPPVSVTAPAQIDMDLSKAENQQVKTEVLTRIDLMPISTRNKDRLYNSVQRARRLGKVLTVPFNSGKTAIGAAEIATLKTELAKPELTQLRDDPTAVFVILGYADPKGDAKKNIGFSQQRAESILEAMRDKCGVQNVMHAVAMGGSTLLDAQKLEKNRIAEIWAVLP